MSREAPRYSGSDVDILGEEGLDEIMGLVRECYGTEAEPRDWWRWRFFEPGGGTSAFIAMRDGGTLIGIQAITLVPFTRDRERLDGCVLTAGMVHPRFRNRGYFRTLVEWSEIEAARRGAAFVLTMPNRMSFPAFMRMGWTDLGDRVLLVLPPWAPTGRNKRRRAGLHIEPFDALGDATNVPGIQDPAVANRMATERSPQWMNWRFRNNPLTAYVRLKAMDSEGRLLGVAVGAVGLKSRRRTGLLVELIAPDPEIRQALVRDMVPLLRSRGAGIIATVFSCPPAIRAVMSLGFLRVPRRISPKRFYTAVKRLKGERDAEGTFGAIDAWHLSLSDWDGI